MTDKKARHTKLKIVQKTNSVYEQIFVYFNKDKYIQYNYHIYKYHSLSMKLNKYNKLKFTTTNTNSLITTHKPIF